MTVRKLFGLLHNKFYVKSQMQTTMLGWFFFVSVWRFSFACWGFFVWLGLGVLCLFLQLLLKTFPNHVSSFD